MKWSVYKAGSKWKRTWTLSDYHAMNAEFPPTPKLDRSQPSHRCKRCGRKLPLSCFRKNPAMRKGHVNHCLDCNRFYQRHGVWPDVNVPHPAQKPWEKITP